jgi:hypothetical protein
MSRYTRIMSAAAIAVACIAGLTFTAGPAAAADRPARVPLSASGTASKVFSVTMIRTSAAAPQQGNAVQEIISCGAWIFNPVRVGSDIRVDVVASCDGIVDKIEIGVGIEINGTLGPDSGKTSPGPTSALGHFVTTPCPGAAKTYRGAGFAVFTKAGYVGSPLGLAGATPRVSINC